MTFVWLLILLVIAGVILVQVEMSERIRQLVIALIVLAVFLWVLNFFGIVTNPNIYIH